MEETDLIHAPEDTSAMLSNVTFNIAQDKLRSFWCMNSYKKQIMLFVGFIRFMMKAKDKDMMHPEFV